MACCRFSTARGISARWKTIEAEVIRFAISHYRGQMSEVARRLHIGRSTLYRKLENLGLGGENPESDEPKPCPAG